MEETKKEELKKILDEQIAKYVAGRIRAMGVEICKCKKCGKEIIWLTSKNKKSIPATLELINHFADCPNAQEFRKK